MGPVACGEQPSVIPESVLANTLDCSSSSSSNIMGLSQLLGKEGNEGKRNRKNET